MKGKHSVSPLPRRSLSVSSAHFRSFSSSARGRTPPDRSCSRPSATRGPSNRGSRARRTRGSRVRGRTVNREGRRKRIRNPHDHRDFLLFVGRHEVRRPVEEQALFAQTLPVVRHPKHAGRHPRRIRASERIDDVGQHRIRFANGVVVGVPDGFGGATRKVRRFAFGCEGLRFLARAL